MFNKNRNGWAEFIPAFKFFCMNLELPRRKVTPCPWMKWTWTTIQYSGRKEQDQIVRSFLRLINTLCLEQARKPQRIQGQGESKVTQHSIQHQKQSNNFWHRAWKIMSTLHFHSTLHAVIHKFCWKTPMFH